MFRTLFMLSEPVLSQTTTKSNQIWRGVCMGTYTDKNYFSFNMELNVAHTHYAEVEMWHY